MLHRIVLVQLGSVVVVASLLMLGLGLLGLYVIVASLIG